MAASKSVMDDSYDKLFEFASDVRLFLKSFLGYIFKKLRFSFIKFEKSKSVFAATLYKKRGKYSRSFVHTGMAGVAAFGMMIAPVVANEFPGRDIDPWSVPTTTSVLSAATEDIYAQTEMSDQNIRDKIIQYTVEEGDTVSSIAEKFGVTSETVGSKNGISGDKIKVGQILEILPVSGVAHKVSKGDTIYSIAKKYDVDAQPIVNFPFNTFMNDETFELAVGQTVIVPGGVVPTGTSSTPRTRYLTPDAGTVVASGSFVWPTSGGLTQHFVWYHKGIDIANKTAPSILAADSGKVVVAGWVDGYGYGNRIVIDHGNGYRTLYAHLSSIGVRVGQTVSRGNVIGRMGSTGRSTGTHLHFEVIRGGVHINPLIVLQ